MDIENIDRLIPQIAKNKAEIARLRQIVASRETQHDIFIGDARDLSILEKDSVHLVLTSPPYWNLKRYNEHPRQMGHIDNYHEFLEQLDTVWEQCYEKLVVGGRMVVVVGDVLLSRRQFGRHKIVPLHADIQVRCETIGFDNLAPIFWHKISNANFEVKGNSKFLGKPYEPNGIIKHDIEYLLMLRKPGSYRKPTQEQRKLSVISEVEFSKWYTQIWSLNGTSTRKHPAPYPEELAERIVRMFSFVGDTVLDPFLGSGTTMVAAIKSGRNSIGIEIDKEYANLALSRLSNEIDLFGQNTVKLSLKEVGDELAIAS
ncbi:site-specific DNA-methyltransferase [candidate division KSB1 bacterium]|nr:site-specific DNA-methyltransferase [candidate division KSB1 bacterium]RQW08782.1 MAG: site-specific DNA-methyltransferase [candidate division KSB1 bacterium]